jgi:hypothetical protein
MDQQPHSRDTGEKFPDELEPLARELRSDGRDAGHISAGAREARDEPCRDEISS